MGRTTEENILRTYWLLNRHGSDGPTALVEIDGRMKIVDIIKFGPDLTELEAQQKVWDEVIGMIGPTLKPFVKSSTVKENGVAPHADLQRSSERGTGPVAQANHNEIGGARSEVPRAGAFKRGTGDR